MAERKQVSCYLITRYTTANKVYQNHALDGDGKPLCGLAGRKQYLSLEYNYSDDEYNVTAVTCKKCLNLTNNGGVK